MTDFSKLAPLKSGGTVGFSSFRDAEDAPGGGSKQRKKSSGGISGAKAEDSDDEDDDVQIAVKMEDIDDKDDESLIKPEDLQSTGELAEGVERIKVCSNHSR